MYDPDDQRDPPEPDDDFANRCQKAIKDGMIEGCAAMGVLIFIFFLIVIFVCN